MRHLRETVGEARARSSRATGAAPNGSPSTRMPQPARARSTRASSRSPRPTCCAAAASPRSRPAARRPASPGSHPTRCPRPSGSASARARSSPAWSRRSDRRSRPAPDLSMSLKRARSGRRRPPLELADHRAELVERVAAALAEVVATHLEGGDERAVVPERSRAPAGEPQPQLLAMTPVIAEDGSGVVELVGDRDPELIRAPWSGSARCSPPCAAATAP